MSGEGLIAEARAVHSSVGHARLKELMHRGTEFLGCDVAIMGGAMSWISERHLVSAISNAGGFGVIACGAMGPELLDTEIAETKTRTDRPFGVNLITMHPQLSELIDVCANHRVTHVVLAGGLPPAGAIDRIKGSGAKLTAFSPALSLAKKLMRSGVDALVIEGMEAGGHIGPVSTSVLAQEILPNVARDIPVFVAGGIGRGEAIAAYLEMGAVGVQLGTRFVCAEECIAHPNFKKAFIRASARDAIPSVQIDPRLPVIPVRALKNQEMVNFAAKQREVAQKLDDGAIAMAEAQLQIEHYWAGALKRAVIDGDVEFGLGDGRAVGRYGQSRGTGRGNHRRAGRRGRGGARKPRLARGKPAQQDVDHPLRRIVPIGAGARHGDTDERSQQIDRVDAALGNVAAVDRPIHQQGNGLGQQVARVGGEARGVADHRAERLDQDQLGREIIDEKEQPGAQRLDRRPAAGELAGAVT